MGKNSADRMKDICLKILRDKIDQVVPVAYAAAVVVLYEQYGFDIETLEHFLLDLQDEWDKITEGNIDARKYCEEKTGITLTGSLGK